MRSTITLLVALVLATIILATEGTIPAVSALTWLILVGLIILALVVFEVSDGPFGRRH